MARPKGFGIFSTAATAATSQMTSTMASSRGLIYPLPQWKGNAYLQGDFGDHSLRLQVNYLDGYTDQRGGAIFGPNTGALAGASVTAGKNIASYTTLDATYRLRLKTGTTIALSALNLLDQDPPFARLDQNYDPFTASPLGFTAKIAITQDF